MRRRQYLAVVASIGATAIAGCSSDGGGGDGDGDDGSNGDDGSGDGSGNSAGDSTGATGTASGASDGGGSGDGGGSDSGGGGESGTTGASGDSGSTGGGTNTGGDGGPIGAVREYYSIVNNAEVPESSQEAISILDPILHSQSPLRTLMSQADPSEFTAATTVTITDIQVVDRNVSASGLNSEYNLSALSFISEDAAEPIAGENAVVEATIERPDQDERTEETVTWITAPEGGEWQVFFNISVTTQTG